MKIIVKTEDGAGIVELYNGRDSIRELEGAQDNENSTFIFSSYSLAVTRSVSLGKSFSLSLSLISSRSKNTSFELGF